MHKKIGIFLFIVAFTLSACAGNQPDTAVPDPSETETASAPQTGISEGDIAPDFELVAMDGTVHRLSDYRGKVVLLNFWTTWCPYCRAEMPDFEDMYTDAYKDLDFVIIAVDFGETKETVQKYLDNAPHSISFPILLDTDKRIFDKYNRTGGTPQTYIIDENGVIHKFISGQWRLNYNSYLCQLMACPTEE